MKEEVLTNAELGEYAATSTDNIMAYYYSDTCHNPGMYGYTSPDTSECSGHTDYEGSKVKEMLESQYITTLGSENLKEVDGYKIRLITLEELQENLGYSQELTGTWYEYSQENTPTWVYNVGYWTMTSDSDSNVRTMYIDGRIGIYGVVGTTNVRPVINLLKSSI